MPFMAPRLQRNARLDKAADNNPPLKRGETSDGVAVLQLALVDLGLPMPASTRSPGTMDGIFGAETERTVKAFQTANGLTVDGVAGRQTLGRLDSIYAAREASERAKLTAEIHAPAPIGPWHVS